MNVYATIHGDRAMYDFYAASVAHNAAFDGHRVMHQVGDVLYDRLGMDALAICGNEYHAGCVHQVLGRDIAASGPTDFDRLTAACDEGYEKTIGACTHGIGHGLTYASKYDPSHLVRDLDQCAVIHKNDAEISPGQSCYTGIFMEYNMHFMESLEGRPRTFASETPLAPCDTLTDPFYKKLCVYWLPPWLISIAPVPGYPSDPYEAAGTLCDSITDRELHTWCVRGIGRNIGLLLGKPEDTRLHCDQATSNAVDQSACLVRAAMQYRFYEQTDAAHQVCLYTGSANAPACDNASGLVVNLKQ